MTESGSRTGILLSGYYGCGNLGDDLLLTVAVEELRTILPGARFFLRDHGADLPNLGEDVISTGVDAILDDQTRSRHSRLTGFIGRIAGLLRQCRWLIFGGGTVFHDNGGLASLALQWLICHLATALGVRIAALGVGVSDLRSATGRWLLRGIVSRSALFLVRDDAALRQCAGTKARLTDDLVFAWRSLPAGSDRKRPSGALATIGLTVSPQAGKSTIAALADAIRDWQQRGHRVVFLVFQQSTPVADDAKVFAAIHAKLGAAAVPIETLRPTASAVSITETFDDIEIVCGMRFHSLVLAAMLERPFVGIAHDNKISEICRRFNMPCHDAAALDGAALVRSAESIRGKAPDPQLLDQSRALAQENFRAFASLAS
jgi:polysaccharide pyruvyl transferase WcaK-like protein